MGGGPKEERGNKGGVGNGEGGRGVRELSVMQNSGTPHRLIREFCLWR